MPPRPEASPAVDRGGLCLACHPTLAGVECRRPFGHRSDNHQDGDVVWRFRGEPRRLTPGALEFLPGAGQSVVLVSASAADVTPTAHDADGEWSAKDLTDRELAVFTALVGLVADRLRAEARRRSTPPALSDIGRQLRDLAQQSGAPDVKFRPRLDDDSGFIRWEIQE